MLDDDGMGLVKMECADDRRGDRERRTTEAMVALYCKAHHGSGSASPCPDCRALLEYIGERISHCPLGDDKTTCRRCPIHCYRPAERERVRRIMRYAGPRLMLTHPFMAIRHLRYDLRGRSRGE